MPEKASIRFRVLPPSTSLFRGGSRARWLLLVLWLLLLGAIGLGAWAVFTTDEQNQLTALEQRMTASVQTRVASLTVWYGTLLRDVETFAATDPVRLFAAEEAGKASASTRNSNLNAEHESQRRFIRTQLEDFRSRQALQGVALYDETGTLLAYAGEIGSHASPTTRSDAGGGAATDAPGYTAANVPAKRLAQVRERGKPETLPLTRTGNGHWAFDLLVPVQKPRYMENGGETVAGVLLVSADVTHLVGELASSGGMTHADGALVLAQFVNGEWQLANLPAKEARLAANWTPGRDGDLNGRGLALTFGLRTLPSRADGGRTVYACGMLVPGPDWLVARVVPTGRVEEAREESLRAIIMAAGFWAALGSLLLCGIWWWMFERRDRAISAELKRLYTMTRRQERLLDGINASIQDGIALMGASGRFLYVNEAFAGMTGESPQTLVRKGCESLLAPDLARCMAHRLKEALTRKDSLLCMEKLRIRDEKRTYQVLCAPFHGNDDASIIDAGVVFVFRDLTAFLAAQERSRLLIESTVQAFMRAVEAVDRYLYGHAAHTRDLAVLLARRLGKEELEETLSTAARLSQVGMIRLPARLLSAERALTPEERVELEKHVGYALTALEGIDFGMPVQQAIAHMYERMDGSGYPEGLAGKALCFEGRILGVASTFCALLRPRSYRKALPLDDCLGVFETEAAKFDPVVVKMLRDFLHSPEGAAFVERLRGNEPPETT